MKKILLTLTLLFAFSFLCYGQKLIDSYFDEEYKVLIKEYDKKFLLYSKDLGTIIINNDEIDIFIKSFDKENKSDLLINISKDRIIIMVNASYYGNKIMLYSLFNDNNREHLYNEIDFQELIEGNIIFMLPKKYFYDLKKNNYSLFIFSEKKFNAYIISNLIEIVKLYEDKINKYESYNLYIK